MAGKGNSRRCNLYLEEKLCIMKRWGKKLNKQMLRTFHQMCSPNRTYNIDQISVVFIA